MAQQDEKSTYIYLHTYLYGHCMAETCQRPLEMNALKNLTPTPLHLQWKLLQLQQYEATIWYKPGSEIQIPDALSRLCSVWQIDELLLDLHVNHITLSDTR